MSLFLCIPDIFDDVTVIKEALFIVGWQQIEECGRRHELMLNIEVVY